ncbi:MAG: hypothetical protein LBR41_00970 [Rickettsiales bacterium]|jgi:hypothetical protein|nr:hypothetical protein [Rickettsiales bacterium]
MAKPGVKRILIKGLAALGLMAGVAGTNISCEPIDEPGKEEPGKKNEYQFSFNTITEWKAALDDPNSPMNKALAAYRNGTGEQVEVKLPSRLGMTNKEGDTLDRYDKRGKNIKFIGINTIEPVGERGVVLRGETYVFLGKPTPVLNESNPKNPQLYGLDDPYDRELLAEVWHLLIPYNPNRSMVYPKTKTIDQQMKQRETERLARVGIVNGRNTRKYRV